jgi:hypothetical protein
VRFPLKLWIILATAVLAVVVLLWTLGQGFGGHPLSLAASSLSHWGLVISDGTDPWVVAAQPPGSLTSQLLSEVTRQAGRPIVAPLRPAVPLVLRSEFDDALQGVYGVDEVLRIARDDGVDTGTFRPVCIARKVQGNGSSRAELYFLVLDSSAFNQMRIDLTPAQPEHAGIGMYDPTTVTPVLVIGSTDGTVDRWWPIAVNRDTDCQARVPEAYAEHVDWRPTRGAHAGLTGDRRQRPRPADRAGSLEQKDVPRRQRAVPEENQNRMTVAGHQ